MQSISTIDNLKNSIRATEARQSNNGKLLKEQFLITIKTLEPGNLLLSTIREVTSSQQLVKYAAGTALFLTTGFFSKQIFVIQSATILRKILAVVFQFGATSFLSKKVESFVKNIQQSISRRNIS